MRPKRVPVEVIERARSAAKEKRVVTAPRPSPAPAPVARKAARDKLVAALKRLHPMD